MSQFDRYWASVGDGSVFVTYENVSGYLEQRQGETRRSHSHRIAVFTQFAKYMLQIGIPCFIPNKGIRVAPLFVTRIEDNDGNVLATFAPEMQEVISVSSAYKMLVMLRAVVNEGTGARVRRLGVKADMGGKTGTTNYNADGWFMGFTPSLVSGCWVGGEDRDIHFDTMLHGQGASMALPIWTKYMVKVLGDKSLGYDENETFQLPEGYNPCKDDINLEGDTHIEEPIEGLDELFN